MKTVLKVADGMIWKLVQSYDADEIARHNGMACSEQFVKKYAGKTVKINDVLQVEHENRS